jgi:tetratricopeptide (TPR) repeat protein
VPYNEISIAGRFRSTVTPKNGYRRRRARRFMPSMQFQSLFASLALAFALSFAAIAPAFAALAEELAEVTRLHHAGQSDAALQRADKYLVTKPKDAQMRFLKAVVLADTGRRPEAAALLGQLVQDYPELPEPHNNLAAIYAAGGEYAKARAELEESIRLNPNYATANENLGDVYAMLAGQSYSRALKLDPSSTTVPRKLAQVRQIVAAGASASAPAEAASLPR